MAPKRAIHEGRVPIGPPISARFPALELASVGSNVLGPHLNSRLAFFSSFLTDRAGGSALSDDGSALCSTEEGLMA